jgi:hypothetical protein
LHLLVLADLRLQKEEKKIKWMSQPSQKSS